MPHKLFSEHLNQELDNIDVPSREDERIDAFSKMFHIPKFKAEALLHGVYLPDETLLQSIAQELEVDPDWLIGKTESTS